MTALLFSIFVSFSWRQNTTKVVIVIASPDIKRTLLSIRSATELHMWSLNWQQLITTVFLQTDQYTVQKYAVAVFADSPPFLHIPGNRENCLPSYLVMNKAKIILKYYLSFYISVYEVWKNNDYICQCTHTRTRTHIDTHIYIR